MNSSSVTPLQSSPVNQNKTPVNQNNRHLSINYRHTPLQSSPVNQNKTPVNQNNRHLSINYRHTLLQSSPVNQTTDTCQSIIDTPRSSPHLSIKTRHLSIKTTDTCQSIIDTSRSSPHLSINYRHTPLQILLIKYWISEYLNILVQYSILIWFFDSQEIPDNNEYSHIITPYTYIYAKISSWC